MTKIITIGTGAPRNFMRSGRICSSTVVFVAHDAMLFDCGSGTTVNLMKAQISPWDIDHLFFTHHHYDHDVDYPTFFLTRWDLGAGTAAKLHVYGPEGTERMTDVLFGAGGIYARDIEARLKWSGSLRAYQSIGGKLPRKPPEVEAHDLLPEVTFERNGWKITTGLALHAQPWLDSLAYRIDTGEGTVVIAGDTYYSRTVEDLAADADVLVLSAMNQPSRGIARLATDARVKKLVLTHFGYPASDPQALQLEQDVRQIFKGEVVMAEDLMEVQV